MAERMPQREVPGKSGHHRTLTEYAQAKQGERAMRRAELMDLLGRILTLATEPEP